MNSLIPFCLYRKENDSERREKNGKKLRNDQGKKKKGDGEEGSREDGCSVQYVKVYETLKIIKNLLACFT